MLLQAGTCSDASCVKGGRQATPVNKSQARRADDLKLELQVPVAAWSVPTTRHGLHAKGKCATNLTSVDSCGNSSRASCVVTPTSNSSQGLCLSKSSASLAPCSSTRATQQLPEDFHHNLQVSDILAIPL